MKATDSKTEWARIGTITRISFVGRETICFGGGCHLRFINILTGQETLYTANHREVGDGIHCFVGHRQQNIFAYTEKRSRPNIFIKTFPKFENICVLSDCPPRGYLDVVFSETSLLIALEDLPNFNLVVWNWKKGEKIAFKDTTICSNNQLLRSCLGSPVYMSQIGVDTTELRVWDIFMCGKKCILTEHVVSPPEDGNSLCATYWTTEGALLVLGSTGSVYTVLPDYSLEKIIDFTAEGEVRPSFSWHKQGLVVAGPNNELRHYKKSGTWSMDWCLKPPKPLRIILGRLDILIGISHESDIYHIIQSRQEFSVVREGGTRINDMCLIYPCADYIICLCHNNYLKAYEMATGKLILTLELDVKALTVESNPKFPYVALGCNNGFVRLYSFYNPKKFVLMTEFHLSNEPLNSIFFNTCGTVFLASNTNTGRFFIIEGVPGGLMEVISTVNADRQIVDYMMVISQNCYRIFTIPVTTRNFFAGNKITRYCVIKDRGIDVKTYTFEDEKVLYLRLYGNTTSTRDRIFFAIPYGQKVIHEIEVKRGENVAQVLRTIETGHQMGQIRIQIDKQHALTWAYDGFVILRGAEFERNIGMALPHHRMDGGVIKAYADPCEKYIISLGKDNIICCTSVQSEADYDLKELLQGELNSQTFKMLFSRRTIGFLPKGDLQGKSWLEVQDMIKTEHEKMVSKIARDSILKEFKSIQHELQVLLNHNLEGPDNEKLEILEFNLDTRMYSKKAAFQKKLRKATEIYLKKLIEDQNRISKFILENFLDKMQNTGTIIRAIFSNYEVSNYVLMPQRSDTDDKLKYIANHRKIEKHLNNNRCFKPWVPAPTDHVIALVTRRPTLPSEDLETAAIAEAIEEEELGEVEQTQSLESRIAFSGSDLEKFIEVENPHYQQNELETYYQAELQLMISKSDCYKLKQSYNKQFDNVYNQKIKDMNTIKEKNDRLRYIVSEINYFSTDKICVRIDDPDWMQVEKPQQIREVKDNEIPITPYISPSEQAILDAKAAEAERIRLLLLADDFRERALMAMMNGVLEVRWEDELKKDVPLPKCMIEKEPEHFNEDDLRTVRDYEEKVKFLNSERERYKTLLTAEYAKTAHFVRECIRRFNAKLSDLLSLKLNMDKVVNQESLKIVKTKLFEFKRTVLMKREEEILQKIHDSEKVISSVNKIMGSLHEEINECKSYVESFQTKDKMLERAFKKDIQEMSIVVQEQVWKLYRRRPKTNIRGLNSASTLNELSKCILNHNYRPPILNNECLDFLRSLDNLDLYVGVPAVVDEATYHLLCKHRRLRIEYEIRLRAATLQVTEGEATVAAFHKRLVYKKEIGIQLNAELAKVRNAMLDETKNTQMQIVIPSGLIEIPRSGCLSDFDDAVLICRKDVEDINKIILEFGGKKIKALQQAMTFHRKILLMEWLHKKFRMQIQDLEEKIFDITNVKLTKEMQAYLKAKNKESTMPFETEVDMIRASYENTIQDRKEIVNRMKKQIKQIQSEDKVLDDQITATNVDVCELNFIKDHELDAKEKAIIESRMKVLLKRDKTVKQIQANHHEILVLQTELELLRLKTYPTLKYKIMN